MTGLTGTHVLGLRFAGPLDGLVFVPAFLSLCESAHNTRAEK
jgi:hypothetical protein